MEITQANRKPIKDISTWIQCFAVYIAALCQQHPSAIQEMLAYMLIIIRAAQEFEDPVWRSYDEAFREKAAATGNNGLRLTLISTTSYSQAMLERWIYASIAMLPIIAPITARAKPASRSMKILTTTHQ